MILGIAPLFAPNRAHERISIEFDEKFILPEGWSNIFEMGSPVSAKIHVYRLEDDVVAQIEKATFSAFLTCGKCLQKEQSTIIIQNSEQIFYSKKEDPLKEGDFMIDHKSLSIDLTPFFLEEMYTHVPTNFVHEDGKCDPEMLKKISELEKDSSPSPFLVLKDILPPPKSREKKKK
ncbi:hypothetical protein HZA38_04065 [Candidatus Peregrinibacteria bacterium]|nr:hypothetical protein [Candidatus Peregrinibacteria bacterium]